MHNTAQEFFFWGVCLVRQMICSTFSHLILYFQKKVDTRAEEILYFDIEKTKDYHNLFSQVVAYLDDEALTGLGGTYLTHDLSCSMKLLS